MSYNIKRRVRNDIRKLKSELQYSEKRRLHAEEQEELSSRERAQLRDELQEVRRHNNDLVQNNKALQEACSMLEEQLTDLEKLADLHELKNKDLEGQLQTVRAELTSCRSRLNEAEHQATERGAAASRAAAQHDEAREQARHAHCELQLLRERLEARETRVAELEARAAALESARAASDAALASAARRVRDLQEECAALRTRAHHHHAQALQLQASLADAQEELAAAREAAEAAASWWRTRETKADATLRQQAKLIDFLQAKVEESGRKKCSLSNKLFGRSGRRPAASPPLRRANRELKEEVERLRAKLAACSGAGDDYPPSTPRREKQKPVLNGPKRSIDVPDSSQDKTLLIVWPDDSRERMHAKCVNDVMVLTSGDREMRARLLCADVNNLPHNEANRAFSIAVDACPKGGEAVVVCGSVAERAAWVSQLCAAHVAPRGYAPAPLGLQRAEPALALYVAPNAVAIGGADGLHSLRGAVSMEWRGGPAGAAGGAVTCGALAGGRALLVAGGALAQAGLLALGSALRRAAHLRPALPLAHVPLPDAAPPHLVKALVGDTAEEPSVSVACGRRVFLLRYDAATSEFKISRSLTVDRPPSSLLLTSKYLFIAGEKPLKVSLPSGALEAFGMDEPTVAAAAKKHSPPKAFLLIQVNPIEILLCYAECGVFIDENGKRTRNEDPKWSTAVYSWEFVKPFLYVIGDDKVTIVYLNEDAYRAPPCTCDATSLASSNSDCYLPEIFTLKIKEPMLLGASPNGIIIRSKSDDGYNVSIVDGMAAFRSIGASVESLATISDTKGSSSDLAQSLSDFYGPEDISQESVKVTTGFLADIRKRARQLRNKQRKDPTPDDVIKEILTTEVEMKRTPNGRKSPATISEFDSDSDSAESEDKDNINHAADLCAEMFTRQVRFQ
ncbi:unnamed protein product [Arctia plantaginis]|uniref:CNH domain-containing protein n=1 Tax=Arctia plantaginis TaxID=874455 RepID=A0A8S0YMW6_ARCPL|nr:unnamed protein product [Arctia plantaginis]